MTKKIFRLLEDGIEVWRREIEISTTPPPKPPPPPPPPPPPGTYTDKVNKAIKLNQVTIWDANMYGFFGGSPGDRGGYLIYGNLDTWFLVDPIAFGILTKPGFKMEFRDYQQGGNLSIEFYVLNTSNELVPAPSIGFNKNPFMVPLDKNSINFNWLTGKYSPQHKYLIKVRAEGNAVYYHLAWWFEG